MWKLLYLSIHFRKFHDSSDINQTNPINIADNLKKQKARKIQRIYTSINLYLNKNTKIYNSS